MRRHTATARRNPSIQKMHKATALQVTRCGQTTAPNTHDQSPGAESCTACRGNDLQTPNTIVGKEVTAARCIKEIALISRQLTAEGYRAVVATYEALVATAHFLAQVCRLAWTMGSLAMVMGSYLYDTGKSLWGRLVA